MSPHQLKVWGYNINISPPSLEFSGFTFPNFSASSSKMWGSYIREFDYESPKTGVPGKVWFNSNFTCHFPPLHSLSKMNHFFPGLLGSPWSYKKGILFLSPWTWPVRGFQIRFSSNGLRPGKVLLCFCPPPHGYWISSQRWGIHWSLSSSMAPSKTTSREIFGAIFLWWSICVCKNGGRRDIFRRTGVENLLQMAGQCDTCVAFTKSSFERYLSSKD